MWLFPFPITRFIPLLLDCHHHDVRLCVQECVCVCLRELVQEDAFWSITSQQALAVIGVRAARLMSVAKASLSKPDSRQADQYNLCHLGASLSSFFSHIHFFLNSLFYFSIDTLSSLRFKCHKKEKKNKLDLFNIQLFFSRQQCS